VLQGESNRFLTVRCFRANFVVFLGLKQTASHFADSRAVIRYKDRLGHLALPDGRGSPTH
jgi:hypothetical protein